ncbi:hypothetical protein ACU4GD_34400 [Cupriavidus basilensis]
MTDGFTSDRMVRPGSDFSVFWSTSYVTLHEGAIKAYDFASIQPVIAAAGFTTGGMGEESFFLPLAIPANIPAFRDSACSLFPYALSYVLFMEA